MSPKIKQEQSHLCDDFTIISAFGITSNKSKAKFTEISASMNLKIEVLGLPSKPPSSLAMVNGSHRSIQLDGP